MLFLTAFPLPSEFSKADGRIRSIALSINSPKLVVWRGSLGSPNMRIANVMRTIGAENSTSSSICANSPDLKKVFASSLEDQSM